MIRLSIPFFAALSVMTAVHADAPTAPHLTLYQNGLAFIEDHRTLSLSAGQTQVTFPAISPQIIPDSVILSIQGNPVISRHFNFDTITPERLLQAQIGKTVTFENDKGHKTTGILRAAQGDHAILEQADGSLRSGSFGILQLTKPDQPLLSTPSLRATFNPAQQSRSLGTLAYLSNGFSWHSSYSLALSPNGETVQLTPWANVQNTTGLDFKNATLSLAAGQISQQRHRPAPMMAKTMMLEAASDAMPATPDSVGSSLKIYRIPTSVDMFNNQVLQVPLMPQQTFKSVRTLVAQFHALYGPQAKSQSQPLTPVVEVQFTNTSEGPLPSGSARLYQQTQNQGLVFIGETALKQTSKGAQVTLISGKSFDVSVTREQSDFEKDGKSGFSARYIQKISNKSNNTELLRLEDQFPEGWRLEAASLDPDHRDGRSAHWTLSIPANSTISLSYTITVPDRR